MTEDRHLVRSYQRIFRPQRRIYEIEGHRLPVPGGIPLAWLAYAIATLLAVLALTGRPVGLTLLLAGLGAAYGGALGGRPVALVAGVAAGGAAQIAGFVVGSLDWPIRLVVVPGLVATVMSQATPDGRSMHRYLASLLALRLRPARRSLGRPLAARGHRTRAELGLWVARDHRTAGLRRGRVTGPASVFLDAPVALTGRKRRRTARPSPDGLVGETLVVLDRGERLEVRP